MWMARRLVAPSEAKSPSACANSKVPNVKPWFGISTSTFGAAVSRTEKPASAPPFCSLLDGRLSEWVDPQQGASDRGCDSPSDEFGAEQHPVGNLDRNKRCT